MYQASRKLHLQMGALMQMVLPMYCFMCALWSCATNLHKYATFCELCTECQHSISMGLCLAAGTTVLVSPWILHRDSSRWQEPEAFKPERWLPLLETRSYMSELSSLGSNGAYVPFGAGPRNCIGTGFAMMEALLVLACILRKVQFRTVPGDAFPTADPRITLRPSEFSLLIDRLEMQME